MNMDHCGTHYNVVGETVTFFGATGTDKGDGRWSLNLNGANKSVWVDPNDSITCLVRRCIKLDAKDGNAARVAMLLLSPSAAVKLWLENGWMIREQSAYAYAQGHVDFSEVEVDDDVLTVRVLEDSRYLVATADSDGNVIRVPLPVL